MRPAPRPSLPSPEERGAAVPVQRQPELNAQFVRGGIEDNIRAVEQRSLDPEFQGLGIGFRSSKPGHAHPGDALRVGKRPGKTETSRVPGPVMYAVVITGKTAETPASASRHLESLHLRRPGQVRRGRPGGCGPDSAEPATVEIRDLAFPATVRPPHKTAGSVHFDAFSDDPVGVGAGLELQRFAHVDPTVTDQPVAYLQRVPYRQRKRRVREQRHLEAKAQHVRIEHGNALLAVKAGGPAKCGEVVRIDPQPDPTLHDAGKPAILGQARGRQEGTRHEGGCGRRSIVVLQDFPGHRHQGSL